MADHATSTRPDVQPMPVVDCALNKHGKRRAGTLPLTEAMHTARTSPDSFVWRSGLRDPTTGQLKVVADAFGLHPLAVEDAVHAHQRPRLERHNDSLFLALKTVVYVEHDRHGLRRVARRCTVRDLPSPAKEVDLPGKPQVSR
ncbi:magnesium transporter CorA family protein [Streptomyces phaeochromogenes]|uniref:hypothetical protein n=1 Tax=Streptomyces phaeochromogenes TaxID=1923 RepID=UPI00371DC8D3